MPNGDVFLGVLQSIHTLTRVLVHSPICLSSFSRKSEEDIHQANRDTNDLETGSVLPGPMRIVIAKVRRQIAIRQGRCADHSIDDEILKIRKCGHTFRAQCLALWFLKGKYECPLCKIRYYKPPKVKRKKRQPRAMQELRVVNPQPSFIPPF